MTANLQTRAKQMAQYYANDLLEAADSIGKVGDVVRAFYVITGLLAGGLPGFIDDDGWSRAIGFPAMSRGRSRHRLLHRMDALRCVQLARPTRPLSVCDRGEHAPEYRPKNHGQPWR